MTPCIRATAYALEIREKAEARAQEIGGKAYEALKRHEFYEAAAKAMQNVVSTLCGHVHGSRFPCARRIG